MKDNLYDEFYDPSEDFLHEPRAFCYDLAIQLIEKAKYAVGKDWHEDINTTKGILLLLYTWNFVAKETKKLNFQIVGDLIHDTKDDLEFLEKYSILGADENAWGVIESIFNKFKKVFGQTGAAKALSLLNSKLFVMWDTSIRNRLKRNLIPGIMNGERGEYYIIFLKGIQKIIKEYKIAEKLPQNAVIAKKIDEYHYVKIVMNKVKYSKTKLDKGRFKSNDIGPHQKPIKNGLPDSLRGRSINKKVIPTVCNLQNMLVKLKALNGNVSLLKPWEKRSFESYRIDKIKSKILNSDIEGWKEIIKDHILRENPTDLGASCIDIYLVAYVAETFGAGKDQLFKHVKDKGISQKDNSAQAIWQVGKGDGVFLEILDDEGGIIDKEFIKKWIRG